MLLLQRHANESVIIHSKHDPRSYLVVRVCEVYPTGDVTLGFIGDNFNVVRTEIFQSGTTYEESANGKIENEEVSKYDHNKRRYYG